MQYKIGIDVGGTKIAYGVYDQEDRLLWQRKEASLPGEEAKDMLDIISAQIQALCFEHEIELSQIKGIGLAVPGHIDFKNGVVITCANLPKWRNVPAGAELERRLKRPIFLDNDANVGALAEVRRGAAKGKENAIYVTISTGIGAGLYLDGKIYRGSYGAAGELGHMLMDTSSRVRCGCGQVGCIEAVASGTGMTKYVKLRLLEGEKSIIPELAGGFDKISPYYVGLAEKEGDSLAIETLEYVSNYLARFFASLYQAFNVEAVVYGGGVTKIGDPLMGRVLEKFAKYAPICASYPMAIVPAELEDELGMLGAALLVE